ncbi:MAG TPA: hypothetical protein VJP89_17280, partial [Pyrinomonadaceae bacterium]|nr:hypothetical protein [Pyrinomonadaceae bacterium]
MKRAGWSTTDRSVWELSVDELRTWQQAENESVLIGTLRRNANEHLRWIKSNRRYYTPLNQTEPRQLSSRWVAIYSPASIRTPGAITHLAEVESVELRKRDEIDTPWQSQSSSNEMQVVYQLRQVLQLERPIENRG